MNFKFSLFFILCFFISGAALSQGLHSGLLSNYPFSGTYIDYSPIANHGTNMGTTFVNDYCGQAANATSYLGNASVLLPYNPAVQIQPPLTFSFRVKFTSYNPSEIYTLWSNIDHLPTHTGYYGIYIEYYSGQYYFHITNGNGFSSSGRRSYMVSKNIVLNQWHLVTVTMSSYSTCSVTIDCLLQTVTNNGESVTAIPYDASNGYFGKVFYPPTGNTRYFNNQLDDFRLWNRALSTPELNRLCTQDTSYLVFEACTSHTFLGISYPSPSTTYIPKGTCTGYYKLSLVLPSADSLVVIDTLCPGQTITFRGQPYAAPFDTLWASTNCDSIFSLKLVQKVADTLVHTAQACASSVYTYRGQPFIAPTDTLLQGATCDSVFRLILSAMPCDTVQLVDSLCSGQAFVFNGQSYYAPADLYSSYPGGDTVYHIILFEKIPKYSVAHTVMGCPGIALDTLGTSYNFPFSDTLISPDCDSLVYLIGLISSECDFECKPFIPNVFTPNNDGLNEHFEMFGGIGPYKLKIFNRWGNLVFSSDDYQNDWDGTYQGQPLAQGVYTYYLECLYINPYSNQSNPDGSPRIYTGTVTIFR